MLMNIWESIYCTSEYKKSVEVKDSDEKKLNG